jgi:hypothetical protein
MLQYQMQFDDQGPMAATIIKTAFWDVMLNSPVQKVKVNMHEVNAYGASEGTAGIVLNLST